MKKIFLLLVSFNLLFSACSSDQASQNDKKTEPTASTTKTASQQTNNTNTKNNGSINEQLVALSTIYLQNKNNGKANTAQIKTALATIKNPELDFVKRFVFESTQQSPALLSDDFMKKPSKENLQRIFQLRHINWNSLSPTGVSAAVLDTFDINAIYTDELLTAYYRLLNDGLQLSRNPNIDLTNVNINLDQLGLESDREKAIAFYTTADNFSRKYNRYLPTVQNNCTKAKDLLKTFPKINGKLLLAATPPPLEDFRVTIGNGAVNKSFETFFAGNFRNAVAHFKKCP